MVTGAYHYPLIPGHEFTGTITQVGEKVSCFSIGQRVTAIPLVPCRSCEACVKGWYNLCDNYGYLGSRQNGGFAEYVVAPADNVLTLPNEVSFDAGATIEAAGGALYASQRAGILPGETVAVFGAGPIGLYAVQWAKLSGASSVIAVDIIESKLGLAKELGADVVIDSSLKDPAEAIKSETRGRGVDVALEFAGAPVAQENCLRSLAKRGRAVFYGISHKELNLSKETVDKLLRRELLLRGAWNAHFLPEPANSWRVALEFMASGRLRTELLISHRFKLDQVKQVFSGLADRSLNGIKILFEIDS